MKSAESPVFKFESDNTTMKVKHSAERISAFFSDVTSKVNGLEAKLENLDALALVYFTLKKESC